MSSAIIKGDEANAKAILNELLGFVFFQAYGQQPEDRSDEHRIGGGHVKGCCRRRARYRGCSEVTAEMYKMAVVTEDIEAVCMWLIHVLEKLILLVFPINSEKKEQLGYSERPLFL